MPLNFMKKILFLILLFNTLLNGSLLGQYKVPLTGKDSIIGCQGTIYDDGGSAADYSNNSSSQYIVRFPGGDSIRLQFTQFDFFDISDSLVLFVNNDQQANKIGSFTGSVLPLLGLKITIPGNRLIIKQYSNGAGSAVGFALDFQGVYPKLISEITAIDTQVCVGKDLILRTNVSGGVAQPYTYKWDGVVGVDTLLIPFPSADTFVVVLGVTDYCLNSSVDQQKVMTYEAIGIEKSNDTTICYGTSVTIVGNVVGGDRIHGGPGFYTRWSTGEFTAGITVKPTVTTTYYVWGGEGCSLEGEDSVKVTVLPKLYISNVLDSILCFGQTYTVNLRDTGGIDASRKVFWSDPFILGTNVVLNPDTGTTNYRVWVEDGCSTPNDTTEFSIYRHPELLGDLVLDKDTLCFGDSTQISISFTGGKPSTRAWSINGISPGITVFKVAPAMDTPLRFELKDGCSADVVKLDTIVVSGKQISHKVVASDTLLCYYETNGFIKVSVSGGRIPYTHRWSDALGTTDTSINNLGIGKYTLVSTDVLGCKDSIRVSVKNEGDILSARSDTTIYRGGKAKLWMNDGMKWKWLPAVAAVSADSNRFYFVRPVKSQQYTVTALDSAGCLWRDTVFVTVVDPPLVRIPNVITPNNDGENDVWDLIEVPNLEQFDIEIYDRPGALVYRTSNYLNDWKAETSSGKQLLSGVYFYYLKNRVTELEYRGFIQVIRE